MDFKQRKNDAPLKEGEFRVSPSAKTLVRHTATPATTTAWRVWPLIAIPICYTEYTEKISAAPGSARLTDTSASTLEEVKVHVENGSPLPGSPPASVWARSRDEKETKPSSACKRHRYSFCVGM